MVEFLEKYSTTFVLLMILASMFLAVPLLLNFGDFITAAFVIAGMTCAILGSFVFMFTGNEPVDPTLVALLPIQSCLNVRKMMLDIGVTGNAFFLPPTITGESRVMQFNSLMKNSGSTVSAKESFTEPWWNAIVPSSYPLMQLLRTRNALIIPDTPNELNTLFNETMNEIFEFTSHVSTEWNSEEKMTVTLHNYRFIEGCIYACNESPYGCSRYPCPACSLCGTLLAECTKKIIILEQCSATSSQDITAVFSFFQPAVPDNDPDSSG
jgi:hypothetical protein